MVVISLSLFSPLDTILKYLSKTVNVLIFERKAKYIFEGIFAAGVRCIYDFYGLSVFREFFRVIEVTWLFRFARSDNREYVTDDNLMDLFSVDRFSPESSDFSRMLVRSDN